MAPKCIWTRLLSLLFGATIYTFSLILAAFLVGLGIGSSIGSSLARDMARPRVALGWCQLLLCAAIAWARVLADRVAAVLADQSDRSPNDPWFTLQLDLVRCLWAVLPAAILWGASFPLALASVAARGAGSRRALVGGVYAANTVGAHRRCAQRQPPAASPGSAASTRSSVLIVVAWLAGLLVLEPRSAARAATGAPVRSQTAAWCWSRS